VLTRSRPRFVSAAVAGLAATALSACSNAGASTAKAEVKELRYQGFANTVTLPEVAAELGFLGDVTLTWVGNTISGPQDIQSAATGQTDFGGAFSGAVAKLITSGARVKAVVNYYGTDGKTFNGFYVKADSPIRSARDLIGKKVAVNTLGAHSEAVVDTYLHKNGLSTAEIKQVQLVVLPPINTETAIRQGQVDVGVLGSVLQDHAVAAGGLRRLFSDYELFGAFNGGQYVLRDDFIKDNPTTARAFVTGVAKAIEWERTTPREQVISTLTRIIDKRGRNESTDNLKYWKSVGVASKGGAVQADDFLKWQTWLQDTGIIHGPLDADALFTNELNELTKG
jgi:ABC-type nitrate/sulfonate/bicarbonate transport system substrate-binding protein